MFDTELNFLTTFDDVIVGVDVDVEDRAAERSMLRRERRFTDADVAGRRLPAVTRPTVGLVEQLELVETGFLAQDGLALRLAPDRGLLRCRKVRR